MDPMTLMLLLQGAKGAYTLGEGIAQQRKASKIEGSLQRPSYEIPSAAKAALENAKAMSLSSKLPGQSYAEGNIRSNTASAIRSATGAASGSADLLASITGIAGNEQAAFSDLAAKGADYQSMNKQRLNEALMSYAPYQEKAWDVNKYQPYEQGAAAVRALKGASRENISNAFGEISKAVSMGAPQQEKPQGGYISPEMLDFLTQFKG